MNYNYVLFIFTKSEKKNVYQKLRFLEPEIWYQTLQIAILYSYITKTIR